LKSVTDSADNLSTDALESTNESNPGPKPTGGPQEPIVAGIIAFFIGLIGLILRASCFNSRQNFIEARDGAVAIRQGTFRCWAGRVWSS